MLAIPQAHRPYLLAAVMASSFMIAVEATIVATAMPGIVGKLGDFRLYAWVFASFLLAQTATTVVFGKLADIYGRRPVILWGIAIFLVGSVLCGFAWSMLSLVLFRLVQGVGAGSVQSVSQTIVGDLYGPHERGKVQGYLASVWGISSILGPLAGAVIVQYASWAWVFWINIPIGLIAAFAFQRWLREAVHPDRESIDYLGALLSTITIAALMVLLTEAATARAAMLLAAGAVCVIGGVLFVLQEQSARHPMVAFSLWARRPIATTNITNMLGNMTIVGVTSFLPIYIQAVLGRSALVAGFALTAMILGWPIAATLAARNFGRFGLRRILVCGAALLPVGAATLLLTGWSGSPLVAAAGSLVIGVGMGLLSTPAIVIVQSSAGWRERGAATASLMFSRSLGSAIGATILGGVLNFALVRQGHALLTGDVSALLRHGGAEAFLSQRAILADALQVTFVVALGIATLALIASLLVPHVALARPDAEAAPEQASPV